MDLTQLSFVRGYVVGTYIKWHVRPWTVLCVAAEALEGLRLSRASSETCSLHTSPVLQDTLQITFL